MVRSENPFCGPRRLRGAQFLHDLWFGELYKTMAINAWAETEAWRIPSNSLVELGIVAEI